MFYNKESFLTRDINLQMSVKPAKALQKPVKPETFH